MSHESLQGSVQDSVLLNIFSTQLEARIKLAAPTKAVENPTEIRKQTYGAVWIAG